MDFQQINNLLRNPSWDIIAIFAFIAVGFFYGISAGKSKLLSLLFSLYVSGFLFEHLYYLNQLVHGRTIMEEFAFRAFIFLAITGVLFVLFSRILVAGSDSGSRNWWKSLLLSFLSTGLLFSYVFHLFPGREIFTFSPIIQNIFASDACFFWWLTLPLIALFLIRK